MAHSKPIDAGLVLKYESLLFFPLVWFGNFPCQREFQHIKVVFVGRRIDVAVISNWMLG